MKVEPAPVWKRLLAYIYDALILTALVLVATLIAALLSGGEAPAWLTQSLIAVFGLGYFWLSWSLGGKTAGMRAWRLRVVTEDGHALSKQQALLRLLACLGAAAPLLLALFTAWFSANRQTIYDRLSKTRVVVEPKPPKQPATSEAVAASKEAGSKAAK